MIDYSCDLNTHTEKGALAALREVLRDGVRVNSLLDVGCGNGTWMSAGKQLGIARIAGVDGIDAERYVKDEATVSFKQVDLQSPFDLNEQFDLVLCLEVAEHLSSGCAETLVKSLCRHGRRIVFSAACPRQPGQHHINCQWPSYWQELFNSNGFVCHDSIRSRIWDSTEIEVWYRQNIFEAIHDPQLAGTEPRIHGKVHPEFLHGICETRVQEAVYEYMTDVSLGRLPVSWYFASFGRAILKRIRG